MCFTRLGVPPVVVPAVEPDEPGFQPAAVAAPLGAAPLGTESAALGTDSAAFGTEPAVVAPPPAGSRRARRAEFDVLADTMLLELAASQTRVTLPAPVEGVLGRIGLTAGDGRSRKGLAIAVVCGAVVVAFLIVSSIAGLLL